MKAYRKTVPIADVVEQVNKMLVDSYDEKVGGREALAVFIERILMDADVYAGYRILSHDGVLDGDDSRRAYWFKGGAY